MPERRQEIGAAKVGRSSNNWLMNLPTCLSALTDSGLEAIKTGALMFRAYKIKHSVLARERCHADLHLAWSFHFGRYQGHAG